MADHASRTYARLNWALIATLALALVAALIGQPRPARAAAFTPGNFVIYRVGTGTGVLTNTGNPVFLDEYTPAGVLVQSIPMPTAPSGSNKPLVASGVAGSEGGLNLSADGRYLVFAGYGAQIPHATSLASTDAAVVNRVIGRVDGLGNVDTSTALNNFAAFDNPREVASDNGTRFWGVSGNGSATDPVGLGGVRFATLGATSATTITSVDDILVATNLRSVNVFGGQLYVSSQQGEGRGIMTVGSGLPTAPPQVMTLLPDFGAYTRSTTPIPTMRDFVMLDLNPSVAGIDTIYSANEYNGVRKFTFNGTAWALSGVVDDGGDSVGTAGTGNPVVGNNVYRRITASVSGTTVTLYVTRYQVLGVAQDPAEQPGRLMITAETDGELVRVVDNSGPTGTFTGSPTVLIPARANIAIRGVAMAPAAPQPDLTVSVAAPAGAVVGAPYDYTLTVANIGTADTSGVSVRFGLPAGVTFGSAAGASGFTGTHTGGVVTFSGGSVAAGGSASLTVTVTPAAVGTVTVAAGAAVADPAGAIAEIDEANNASTGAASTNVQASDTSAPATTITAQPDSQTTSTSASFSFTGEDDVTPAGGLTFECSIDTEAFAPCSSPQEYTNLAVGAHTFQVRAKDAAGNTDATPAIASWTVVAVPEDTDEQIYLPVVVR